MMKHSSSITRRHPLEDHPEERLRREIPREIPSPIPKAPFLKIQKSKRWKCSPLEGSAHANNSHIIQNPLLHELQ